MILGFGDLTPLAFKGLDSTSEFTMLGDRVMSNDFTSEIVYKLTNVSNPTFGPDGTKVAFVKSRIDQETMETSTFVMVVDLDTREIHRFTRGANDSEPKYSPDGNYLAFLRPDDHERKQIWIIPTSGGEAVKLTNLTGGASELSWSPDSLAIAFISDVNPDQLPDDHNPKIVPQVREVHRIRYRADGIGWRGESFRHVFVVDITSSKIRQVTCGEGEDSAPSWAPNGTKIGFISDRGEHRDIVNPSGIYTINPSGDDFRYMSPELNSVAAMTWSPDSGTILAVGSDVEDANASSQSWLFVLKEGHAPKKLTDDSISPAGGNAPLVPAPDLHWTSDDRVVFLAGHRGMTSLHVLSIDNQNLEEKAKNVRGATQIAFNALSKRVAINNIPTTSAGDLLLIDLVSDSVTQITNYNEHFFEENPAATVEKFNITRAGHKIESRLLFPRNFDAENRHPLILDIHGGPHGVFTDSFNVIQQVMTASGYLVLAVNPRGSSTYGVDFMKSVLGDWGGEDYQDIMSALDEVCQRDYVDSSRLGITGYSYGGFMSSWAIGHNTRFKAAVVGAPCINLSSMYGTSDIGVRFGEAQWGGPRNNALEEFLYRSPLTYAAAIETPVLLLHGEADLRCPIEQSEQYFVTLKRLGKTVEFVRFPGGYHGFVRGGHPRMRVEYLSRLVAWMDKHVLTEVSKT